MSGPNPLSMLSVLVVEDNPHSASLLAAILRELRVGTVHRVENGEQAMDLLRAAPEQEDEIAAPKPRFDLVMSDWEMRNGDGLSLLHWVRNSGEVRDASIPFVMVTGVADRERVNKAREQGVTDMLVKPFSVEMVARKLLALFRDRRKSA